MEALIAKRICLLCVKQGRNHARIFQRQVSSVLGPSYIRWYPVQSLFGQKFVRRMCSEQKPAEQKEAKEAKEEATKEAKPDVKDYSNLSFGDKMRLVRESGDQSRANVLSWKTVTIFIVLGGAVVLYVRYLNQMKELEEARTRVVSMGELALGGAFDLKNTKGETVTEGILQGKWSILYFGFTHCPDVCPDELEKVVAAVNVVDSNAAIPNLKPIFITVDPARDTEKVVEQYIAEFSPKILGLTGTSEQVDRACKAFRIYYSAGPKDEDDDYIVDHSIITYLVNPNGKVTDYFGKSKTAKEVAAAVEKRMRQYRDQHKQWQ